MPAFCTNLGFVIKGDLNVGYKYWSVCNNYETCEENNVDYQNLNFPWTWNICLVEELILLLIIADDLTFIRKIFNLSKWT